MMDRQKIIDKIIKCLALARSAGASPNEAETALRQARSLMEKHQIDMDGSELQLSDIHEADIALDIKAAPQPWMVLLANVCANAFGCSVLTSGFHDRKARIGHWRFLMIGSGISAELAKYAFDTLRVQLSKERKAYVATLKRCKLATKRRRGELFTTGWIHAVQQKVADFSGTDSATALAIATYTQQHFPEVSSRDLPLAKARTQHDAKSSVEGYLSGLSAELNHGVAHERCAALQHSGD